MSSQNHEIIGAFTFSPTAKLEAPKCVSVSRKLGYVFVFWKRHTKNKKMVETKN